MIDSIRRSMLTTGAVATAMAAAPRVFAQHGGQGEAAMGMYQKGDVHIHFYGAGAFSFGAGIELQDGDVAEIEFEGFGRPLRNSVVIEKGADRLVTVRPA